MRSPGNSRVSAGTRTNQSGNSDCAARERSVRVQVKLQGPGSHEGHLIAPPPPGGGFAERGNQIVVRLRPRRRTVAALQLAGNEDHRIARDRELACPGLAPQIELRLAIVADLKRRNP